MEASFLNRSVAMMIFESGATWMVVEAKARRSLLPLIEERDAANQCIVCGHQCDHTEKNRRKRGLCPLHHGRFIANRPDGIRKRASYEADCIENGELMPRRDGQRIGQVNTYKTRARKASA